MKDDAPWLDATYDGFMTGAELGFTTWFNEIYGVYSHRCEWFFGDCEVEDVKTRKDLLYKWIHAAYCAGYSENKALKALDKLYQENDNGMKELADDQ